MRRLKYSSLLLFSLSLLAAGGVSNRVLEGKLFDSGAPKKGPDKAKVTIVEYSDFQCPYCAGMAVRIEALRAAQANEVRVIWMDYPLRFHAFAMTAHEAAAEAAAQGKFWEMQQWIFLNQSALFPDSRSGKDREASLAKVADSLVNAGTALGMDRGRLKAALADHRHRDAVLKRKAMGEAIGVDSTPTIFVNGVLIGYDWDEIKKAVEAELKK